MIKHFNVYHFAIVIAGAAMFCASVVVPSEAEAVDLRSWDQKIDQVAKRFRVLGDFDGRAVLDVETQLVWHRTPSSQLRTWSGAFNSCHGSYIGGRGGWRLPYMEELTSLIDRTEAFPPLPSGHPFDVSNLTTDAWSANTVVGTDEAYTQDMRNDGYLGSLPKHLQRNYWCVRGGHGADGQ